MNGLSNGICTQLLNQQVDRFTCRALINFPDTVFVLLFYNVQDFASNLKIYSICSGKHCQHLGEWGIFRNNTI